MKIKIIFSLLVFTKLFCAEENNIQITDDKNPVLCRFTNFVEKFNSADISEKVNRLCDFYRDTHKNGKPDYRRRKAYEIREIAHSLFPLVLEAEELKKLSGILSSIAHNYPNLINLSDKIEDGYFKP